MKEREPYLYSAMCFISTQAIADAPEMIGNETQTAIHDALWRAVLVAIEAYRVAQYHLWADTCLRPQMQSLHPDIASRSNPCELPRGGELDAPE